MDIKDWTHGYVADVNYEYNFFPELAPINIVFNLLNAGLFPPSLENFTYCELGCGHGFTTNILAASYPSGDFWAFDFNPSHAAEAKRLATEAQLNNITILDSSFEDFIEIETPQFDFIVLHGVYSWVSEQNREYIIEILQKKLNIGGAVYLSYNTLPGWSALMPLRELMVQYTRHSNESTLQKVETAIDFAKQLQEVKADYFLENPTIQEEIKDLEKDSKHYVAHEFFNQDSRAFYYSEVAQELKAAKLTFAVSADLDTQFEDIGLSKNQLELLSQINNFTLQETIRDFYFNTRFRRDIFIKGPVKLKSLEKIEILSNLRFILLVDPQAVPFRIELAGRKISLDKMLYSNILAALSKKNKSLRELMQEESLKTTDFSSIFQALKILMVMDCLSACLSQDEDPVQYPSANRLNAAILRRARMGEDTQFLAASVIGNGIQISRSDQLFLLAYSRQVDPVLFIWNLLKIEGEKLIKEGKILNDEESQAEIRMQSDEFNKVRLPLLQKLGMVPRPQVQPLVNST